MLGTVLVGVSLLLIVCAALVIALLSGKPETPEERLLPVAVLPVPDGKPSTRAFLEHLASQVAWMDTNVLRCVLLVYPEHAPDIQALCEEMEREYAFYTAISLPDVHRLLDARTLAA